MMPGDEIPDIFRKYYKIRPWMEVRDQVMEGLRKDLWKLKFSSVPPPPNREISEKLPSDAPMKSPVSKRKPEEECQTSKKTCIGPKKSIEDLFSDFEDMENFIKKVDPVRKQSAEQMHIAKQTLFKEFFEKWKTSHPLEEFESESDESESNGNESNESESDKRLKIILKVLKENSEPALEEWTNAYIENDVGAVDGSASMNYCIFNKNDFGHDLRFIEKDLQKPSTLFQQTESASLNNYISKKKDLEHVLRFIGKDLQKPSTSFQQTEYNEFFEAISSAEEEDEISDVGRLRNRKVDLVTDIPASGIIPDNEDDEKSDDELEFYIPGSGIVSSDNEEEEDFDDELDSYLPESGIVPDNEEDEVSDEELDLFSFFSNRLKDQSVPVRNQHLTSAEQATSDISAYVDLISNGKKVADSQHPFSASVEQNMVDDDKLAIDFNLLSMCGLKPKAMHTTNAGAQSNDGPSLYTTSSYTTSSTQSREIGYAFSKRKKKDIMKSENLHPCKSVFELKVSSKAQSNDGPSLYTTSSYTTSSTQSSAKKNVPVIEPIKNRLKSSLDFITDNPRCKEEFRSVVPVTKKVNDNENEAIVPISPESKDLSFEYDKFE